MTTGSLLLLALSLNNSRANTVSYSCGATRVPVILKALSAQTGLDLRATPALEDEVLFISVKDAPVRDLTDEIAQVTHASWQANGGAYYLTRTAQQLARDENAETALNLGLLQKQLASDQELGHAPTWSAEEASAAIDKVVDMRNRQSKPQTAAFYAEMNKAFTEGSVPNRAVARLFAATDPAIFADLRPWQFRLYTLRPTQFQFELSDAVGATLADFVQEERYVRSRLDGLNGDAMREMAQRIGTNAWYLGPIGGPIIPIVKARMPGLRGLNFEISFCDRAGRGVESGYRNITLDPEPDLSALTDISTWGKTKIELPAFVRQWSWGANGATKNRPDPAIVSEPLTRDPLGFIFDGPLSTLVAAFHHDVVAALPDECAQEMIYQQGNLAGFCRQLAHTETFAMDKGRLLIAPIRRATAYSLRARRAPLDGLVKLCRRQIPTLEDTAAYVLEQNETAAYSGLEFVVFSWNQCTNQQFEAMNSLTWAGQRSKLMFYGLLSADQKQRMSHGGVRFRELTSDEKRLVTHWLYNDDAQIQAQMSQAEQDQYMAASRQGLWISPSILDREPSFAMPDGVPGDALVKLNEATSRAAHIMSPDGNKAFWDCNTIGYIAAQQERGEWQNGMGGYPSIAASKMAPAWRRNLSFSLQYTPRLSEGFSLSDASMVDSNYVRCNELPADWWNPISKTLEEYRKMFRNMPAQQYQQASPPAL